MEREQTWIRAIQRRNSREAAEQLIQTYYDEIYRFVYRQTGSKEDAMDLTQSVFIAVLRALPGYRAERASFRTWLYRQQSHRHPPEGPAGLYSYSGNGAPCSRGLCGPRP